MVVFRNLTRTQRGALLGGVSLIALQGISACAEKAPMATTAYTPPVNTPAAPAATATGYQQVVQGTATTLAIGEEDGGVYVPGDSGTITTLAVGEEDGSGPVPVEPDGGVGNGAAPPPFATTLAIGEEDGDAYAPADPGTVTTLAIGEEDGGIYTPDQPGTVTTLAIGEEDGSGPIPVEPDGGIGDDAGPPPFATTLALGEEDGTGTNYDLPGTATTLAIGEEG